MDSKRLLALLAEHDGRTPFFGACFKMQVTGGQSMSMQF